MKCHPDRSTRARLRAVVAALVTANSGCGGRNVFLDGDSSRIADAGSNGNSNPDAIAPGVTVVIENQETAKRIAVDETRLYWLSRLPNGWNGNLPARYGRIRSCQKNDCPSTVTTYDSITFDPTVSKAPPDFYGLAAIGDNVYWARYDGDALSILTCASAGCAGAPRVVVGDIDLTSMAVDDTHVYWASSLETAIFRLPLSGGGKPQAIALNQVAPDRLVLTQTHAYWIAIDETGWSIRRVLKQGGEPPVTMTTEPGRVALAVDADSILLASADSVGPIARCPSSGCTGAPTAVMADQTRVTSLSVDGKSMMWMSAFDFSPPFRALGTVARCAIASCGSTMETLAVQTFALDGMSMVIDRTDIYWVAQGDEETPSSGFYPQARIYRHAK